MGLLTEGQRAALKRGGFITLLTMLSAACGDSGGSTSAGPVLLPAASPVTITGAVVANEVDNAQVRAYRVVDGVRADAPVATASTNDSGRYSMTVPDCPEPCMLVLQATSGAFTNEFTGKIETIPIDTPVRAGASDLGREATIVLTTFTEAALRDAESDGDLDAGDITASNATMARLILGANSADHEASATLLSTIPETTTAIPAPDNGHLDDQQPLYGLMLAGAAAYGNTNDTARAIAQDVADGVLDEQADALSAAVTSILASDLNNTGLHSATAVVNQNAQNLTL